MGIDPLTSLAFAVRANPGAYALLIGSGVSTGAGIPTGWAIVLDLIRRVAMVEGEVVPDHELQDWYTKRYGETPAYSAILDRLARTPADRQGLIRRYIEPTEEERAGGLKVPTGAHRAIARLVAGGFVRVLVTTNFDRLIEQALDDAGVDYDVVASVDAIGGTRPIGHAPCLVLKVHGDYRDARIRTAGELERYEPKLERFLNRILEDHGLVVCGWSAAWDSALRAAQRRYGVSGRSRCQRGNRDDPGGPRPRGISVGPNGVWVTSFDEDVVILLSPEE